jgi:hypothetical protein
MNAVLLKLSRWNWVMYLVAVLFFGWHAYDVFVPVLWMRGEMISKGPDHVVIRMSGYKLRECRYLGVQAYSLGSDGIRHDATIQRIDVVTLGITRPRGYYDLGRWDIRPTAGATGVVVYAQHACDETDLRATKMVEVRL